MSELKKTIDAADKCSADTDQFITLVRKYSDVDCLTPRMVRELISKIYVYSPEKVNGMKRQRIEIEFNFIGNITLPTVSKRETA